MITFAALEAFSKESEYSETEKSLFQDFHKVIVFTLIVLALQAYFNVDRSQNTTMTSFLVVIFLIVFPEIYLLRLAFPG